MKCIKYFSILFILFFCVGCASSFQRGVMEENIFFSSSQPKIKIKIDSSFEYLGKMKKMDVIEVHSYTNTFKTTEAFIFGNIGDDNTFKNGVVINFISLGDRDTEFITDGFSWIKYQLESKTIKINKKTYQKSIFPAPFFFRNEIRNIIFDKEYVIPNSFLMQGLSRNVSLNNNMIMQIYYMDEISSFNKEKNYELSEWIDINKLREDQQKRLNEFMTTCQKNIQFLE